MNPRFADVVKEAIRHERNKSSNIVVFGEDGRRLNRDFVPTGLRFKEAAESSHFRMDLATSELLQQCTGISEWTTLEVRSKTFPFKNIAFQSLLIRSPVCPRTFPQIWEAKIGEVWSIPFLNPTDPTQRARASSKRK